MYIFNKVRKEISFLICGVLCGIFTFGISYDYVHSYLNNAYLNHHFFTSNQQPTLCFVIIGTLFTRPIICLPILLYFVLLIRSLNLINYVSLHSSRKAFFNFLVKKLIGYSIKAFSYMLGFSIVGFALRYPLILTTIDFTKLNNWLLTLIQIFNIVLLYLVLALIVETLYVLLVHKSTIGVTLLYSMVIADLMYGFGIIPKFVNDFGIVSYLLPNLVFNEIYICLVTVLCLYTLWYSISVKNFLGDYQ